MIGDAAAPYLYCGGKGFAVAKVDAASGRVIWRSGVSVQNARPIGVQDGLVYVYQQSQGTRWVVALDADTKKPVWTHETNVGEPAYLFSGGLLAMSPDSTHYVAYGTSGQILWQTPAPDGVYREPVVLGGVPYGLSSPGTGPGQGQVTLTRLDPANGTQRQLATLPQKALSVGAIGGRPLFLAPQTAEDVQESGYERPYTTLLRVNPGAGTVSRIPLPRVLRGSATLLDGVVYFVQADGTVTAVSATTGKQLWRKPTGVKNLSAPALSSAYGRVYLAGRSGRLLALDSRTGAEAWRTAALDAGATGADALPPSVLLVKDAIVATAGDTAFSVGPDPAPAS